MLVTVFYQWDGWGDIGESEEGYWRRGGVMVKNRNRQPEFTFQLCY